MMSKSRAVHTAARSRTPKKSKAGITPVRGERDENCDE
ncbi:hypothetical protein SF83666_b64250 (plasmid) [Sinorhizobium fredii CCBAU 83666]|nr:hypothetical protein SF83666_b64250 [Sinorhizobium fredii CCBAU 83666]